MADDKGERIRLRLTNLESRLVVEYGGDAEADALVHAHFAEARDHFADAKVRQYVPILVERIVRLRLREHH